MKVEAATTRQSKSAWRIQLSRWPWRAAEPSDRRGASSARLACLWGPCRWDLDRWSSCKALPGTAETCRARIWSNRFEFTNSLRLLPNRPRYLGIQASAIHCKSMLQARRGMCGYCGWAGGLRSWPLVISTSMMSWRALSHSIGSCISTTASMGGKLWSIFVDCPNANENFDQVSLDIQSSLTRSRSVLK